MVAASEAWKRTILWLEPCSGCFLVGVILDKVISELRLLAQLTREPVSSDLRAAIGRSHALGETINTRFDHRGLLPMRFFSNSGLRGGAMRRCGITFAAGSLSCGRSS